MTINQIKINGFLFLDLLEMELEQQVNMHPTAVVKGHIAQPEASLFLQQATAEKLLVITANDSEGTGHTLFSGVLSGLSCITANDASTVVLQGIGHSSLCDVRREIRVFQDGGMTYEQVCQSLTSQPGASFIVPENGADATGGMLVQYEETDWEFARRIAGRLGTVLIADARLDFPNISIGIPSGGKVYQEDPLEYTMVMDVAAYRDLKENGVRAVEDGQRGICYKSRQFYSLCDQVVVDGVGRLVYRRKISLEGSELIAAYELRTREGFQTREQHNMHLIGASLAGSVEKVEKDQVQVSLAYDVEGGGKRWFAYSTPYSSPDGTGWYFMPEPGDEIRLHFPTQEEDAAYVVSSTHITHGNRSDPEVKFIRTQRGQEITFAPDSIHITDGNGSSIRMDKKQGITLKTSKGIKIDAADDISIKGKSGVVVEGGKSVQIRQNDSLVQVQETIDITAAHVRVQ